MELKNGAQTAVLVFCAYCLGAEAAFFIGTLSDKIFAPFWPPNTVLMCALLFVAPQRRWICIVAAIPAHVIVESRIGMPIAALAVAFVTNASIAALSAAAIKRFLNPSPWFGNFNKAAIYIVVVGIGIPATVALGGALVPMLGGGHRPYWTYWGQWLASNALGNLTLGPIALLAFSEGARSFWPRQFARQVEAVVLSLTLIVVCDFAFVGSAGHSNPVYLPALLYSPVPLIIWAAARFGVRGASFAILAMTLVLTWRTLNGPSLFIGGSPETNVFALQIFLASLAVPILLLGASIEEVRLAARKTHDDEERMAFVAASANIGLWDYDSGTRQFWATAHCKTMLGLSAHAALTYQSLLDTIHPDDRAVVADITAANPNNNTPPIEFRISMPNGQTRWMVARAAPRIEDSEIIGTTGVFSDITAQKAAEAEAYLQRRELAHLMRVSQVGELSSGLAHEITQPLTAILANAQAARLMLEGKNPDLDDLAEVLDDIIEEDNRAGEVIGRIRTLLKNGKDKLEAVNLNDLVNLTLRLLHSEMISHRIKVNVVLADDIQAVSGDAVQLQQVLLNLVTNAIDSVNQMSTLRRVVTMRTRMASPDTMEVSVEDRGTGVGPADLDRLFEPFFTTKERGLGLGLSICSTIIKRHGGELSLDNNSDGGATARFVLPVRMPKET
jgi:PAS domain S-box-containing protein